MAVFARSAVAAATISAMILGAVSAQAQTAAAGSRLAWDQPNVASAAVAQALTYRHFDDGATAGTVLTGVACTGTAPIVCSAPFPAYTPGAHTIRLTAANTGGESAPSAPLSFTFVAVPTAPTGLRIQ